MRVQLTALALLAACVLASRTPHVPVYLGNIVQTTPPPASDLA